MKLQDIDFPPPPVVASYLLFAAGLLGVLASHMVGALFSGLLVFLLVQLAQPWVGRFASGHNARVVATLGIAIIVVGGLVKAGLWIAVLLHSGSGLDALWVKIAETIDSANGIFPPWVLASLPSTASDLKDAVVHWLREHAAELRLAGKEAGVGVVQILIGMLVAALVAVQEVDEPHQQRPLARALSERIARFYAMFRTVFVAQGKIATINATLTGIYLLGVLPALGISLPFVKTMILVTWLVGFLPVAGNLISNTIIVLISLSASALAAVLSLAFLILVHKLEWLVIGKVVGEQIGAKAWEILLAMLVMERLFGPGGLAIAPVTYAYVKAELKAADLI